MELAFDFAKDALLKQIQIRYTKDNEEVLKTGRKGVLFLYRFNQTKGGKIINITQIQWKDIAQYEIKRFERSDKRYWMNIGKRYYTADHDILHQQRTVIGEEGRAEFAENLADNRLVHPFLRELIDQKVQYLLGLPFSVQATETLQEKMESFFDSMMMATLQMTAKDAICYGMGWIHVFLNEKGKIKFRRCNPNEMIPIWKDAQHTQLEAMIRCYTIDIINNNQEIQQQKVEIWTQQGVYFYEKKGHQLIIDKQSCSHLQMHQELGVSSMNWEKIPFIPIQYNDEAQPLIQTIKQLIDDYDRIVSDESNALQDQPNSILVVRNYDGQKLGDFRKNLATYRAVKVSDDGGVTALNTPIDSQATTSHLERLRRDIYAFGRGVDIRSERLANAVSGIALKQAYAGLDLDCNGLESHMKTALQKIVWFLTRYWKAIGEEDLIDEATDFIFNRDIIIHEQAAVEMCKNSQGIISEETILANHPWVRKVSAETKRLQQERSNDDV